MFISKSSCCRWSEPVDKSHGRRMEQRRHLCECHWPWVFPDGTHSQGIRWWWACKQTGFANMHRAERNHARCSWLDHFPMLTCLWLYHWTNSLLWRRLHCEIDFEFQLPSFLSHRIKRWFEFANLINISIIILLCQKQGEETFIHRIEKTWVRMILNESLSSAFLCCTMSLHFAPNFSISWVGTVLPS